MNDIYPMEAGAIDLGDVEASIFLIRPFIAMRKYCMGFLKNCMGFFQDTFSS